MKKPNNGITGIYKITNPKGRVYIGKSKNILNRWYKYNKIKCEGQIKLYNSLKKYGPDNHIFEIIEECSEDKLIEREIFHKQQYLKLSNISDVLFCNINDGNSGPSMQTLSANLKRSSSLKEYYKTNTNPAKGKSKSLEFKEKHFKPVLQYDLAGNFIKEWPSQLEVKNQLGSDINNCLTGIYKTSGGFQWIYKTTPINQNIYPVKGKIERTKTHCENIRNGKIGKGLKPIIQLDLNGNFIEEWESQSKASKCMGISIGCINLCLNKNIKSAGGFKWVYKKYYK